MIKTIKHTAWLLLVTVALFGCEKETCKHCKLLEINNIAPVCGYAYNGDGWEESVVATYGMICDEQEIAQLRKQEYTVKSLHHSCGKEYTTHVVVECE